MSQVARIDLGMTYPAVVIVAATDCRLEPTISGPLQTTAPDPSSAAGPSAEAGRVRIHLPTPARRDRGASARWAAPSQWTGTTTTWLAVIRSTLG